MTDKEMQWQEVEGKPPEANEAEEDEPTETKGAETEEVMEEGTALLSK